MKRVLVVVVFVVLASSVMWAAGLSDGSSSISSSSVSPPTSAQRGCWIGGGPGPCDDWSSRSVAYGRRVKQSRGMTKKQKEHTRNLSDMVGTSWRRQFGDRGKETADERIKAWQTEEMMEVRKIYTNHGVDGILRGKTNPGEYAALVKQYASGSGVIAQVKANTEMLEDQGLIMIGMNDKISANRIWLWVLSVVLIILALLLFARTSGGVRPTPAPEEPDQETPTDEEVIQVTGEDLRPHTEEDVLTVTTEEADQEAPTSEEPEIHVLGEAETSQPASEFFDEEPTEPDISEDVPQPPAGASDESQAPEAPDFSGGEE